MCWFCNVFLFLLVRFVMCGGVYVWVLYYLGECMCEFFNMCLCVYVGFVVFV